MRPFAFVPLVLAGVASTPATAQTGPQPTLALTILAGTVIGHELWTVDKQPLQVEGTSNVDTLRLSRSLGSGIVLGAAATYFLSPHVGVHGEVVYLGLSLDASCGVVGSYNPDPPDNRNMQVCNNIGAQGEGGSTISISAGLTLRAAPRGSISPYARGSVGFVNFTRSTIDLAGGFLEGGNFFERQVIIDPEPGHSAVMLGAAVGFVAPLGPAYQFRLEVQDAIFPLDRVTGPASGLAVAPVESRWYHHPTLKLGLDIVLERKRGRRY